MDAYVAANVVGVWRLRDCMVLESFWVDEFALHLMQWSGSIDRMPCKCLRLSG